MAEGIIGLIESEYLTFCWHFYIRNVAGAAYACSGDAQRVRRACDRAMQPANGPSGGSIMPRVPSSRLRTGRADLHARRAGLCGGGGCAGRIGLL